MYTYVRVYIYIYIYVNIYIYIYICTYIQIVKCIDLLIQPACLRSNRCGYKQRARRRRNVDLFIDTDIDV